MKQYPSNVFQTNLMFCPLSRNADKKIKAENLTSGNQVRFKRRVVSFFIISVSLFKFNTVDWILLFAACCFFRLCHSRAPFLTISENSFRWVYPLMQIGLTFWFSFVIGGNHNNGEPHAGVGYNIYGSCLLTDSVFLDASLLLLLQLCSVQQQKKLFKHSLVFFCDKSKWNYTVILFIPLCFTLGIHRN